MGNLIKVREIITLKGWVEDSGWSFSQCYSDSVIDIVNVNDVEWDWYETSEENPLSGTDTQIIVDFYAVDADIDEDLPLATHSKWASEIWKERHQ